MADIGHTETDKLLKDLEQKVAEAHNMLLGDLRYLLDFTAVVSGDADVLTRRGLTSGVNYIYFF